MNAARVDCNKASRMSVLPSDRSAYEPLGEDGLASPRDTPNLVGAHSAPVSILSNG